MAPLSVVMIASEAEPFAKTGGLADATGTLAAALGRLGHEVTLMLPRYRGLDATRRTGTRHRLRLGRREFGVGYLELELGNQVRAVLVDCPELYDREQLYGIGNDDYADNAVRFAVLVRAALEWAAGRPRAPHIVHAHDWQAGLAPVYLATDHAGQPLGRAAIVFTIHNLAYQGLFPGDSCGELDIPGSLLSIDGLEYWGKVSFLKAGINFSDAITTVSPSYAKEILTPDFGFGFDGILSKRQEVLTGIINGIDTTRWNPATDPHLPSPFSADDLSGKRRAKRELLQRVGLPTDEETLGRPIVAMISRLVDQKGLDLIAEISTEIPGLGATWVVLGSGEPRYEQLWRGLAARHSSRVAVRIGFDEGLAHLIEGGADMFLMPSRFEPCGLGQMYSLRYGTVPIVRATGGLDDTVTSYNPQSRRGTGFKFREYSSPALLATIQLALGVFARPADWRAIQQAGMRQDHSWDVSAQAYVKVYRRALMGRRRGVRGVLPRRLARAEGR